MTEQPMVFLGTQRDTLFLGTEMPVAPVADGCTLDMVIESADLVPFAYRAGDVIYAQLHNAEKEAVQVFDYTWTISGADDGSGQNAASFVEWAARELVKSNWLKERGMHAAYKVMRSDNPKYPAPVGNERDSRPPRFVLVRVFRNADFPCEGHSELFINVPMGMYHCAHCNEMQVAGTFHLPKEFDL